MTVMSLYSKYELEKLVASGEVTTFRARETATGRLVFLHMVGGSGRTLILEALRRWAPGAAIESGELDDTPFIVTEPIAPFTTFPAWLDQLAVAGQASVEAHPVPPQDATLPIPPPRTEPPSRPLAPAEPGEFTRIFSAAPGQPAKPQSSAAPEPGPGEFTRSFGALSTPSSQASPPAAGPGEFTRMFSQVRPSTPPGLQSVGLTPAPSPAPGPAPDHSPAPPPGPSPTPGPAPPLGQTPLVSGSASGLFSAQAEPVQAAEPPLRKPQSFTSYFQRPADSDPIDMDAIDRNLQEPVLEGPNTAPFRPTGAFTRLFGRPGTEEGATEDVPEPSGSPQRPMRPELDSSHAATGLFAQPAAPAQSPPYVPSGHTPADPVYRRPPDMIFPPPGASYAAPLPPRRSRMLETVLIVAASMAFVLALVFVVYLASR